MAGPSDLRALMARVPGGVAVVTASTGGERVGLTVGTLVALSLDPPLVGFAVSRQAAMHELLREAGAFGVSVLAAGQEALAQHFARGVPPLAMWQGVDVLAGEGAPLLAGAVGWLRGRLEDEVRAGTHTFFVGAVTETAPGVEGPALVRVRGAWGAA